jgi:hypothetical protein
LQALGARLGTMVGRTIHLVDSAALRDHSDRYFYLRFERDAYCLHGVLGRSWPSLLTPPREL